MVAGSKYRRGNTYSRRNRRYGKSAQYKSKRTTGMSAVGVAQMAKGVPISGPTYAIGMPSRSRVIQMKYSDSKVWEFENQVGGFTNKQLQVYRGNSIYDPDFTGTGHQPLGHDQYSSFYHKYCVVGAYVTVRFVPCTDTYNEPIQAGTGSVAFSINISDGNGVGAQDEAFWENPHTITAVTSDPIQDANRTITLKKYVSNPRFLGRTRDEYVGEKDFQAEMGSNPTTGVHINLVGVANIATAGSQAVHKWRYTVYTDIVYNVLMLTPKNISQS